MIRFRCIPLLACMAVAALWAPAALAAPVGTEILLDFNDDDSDATTYGTWNEIANHTNGYTKSLVDKDNNATGYTLEVTSSFAASTVTNAGQWTDPAHPWVDSQSLGDYFLVQDNVDEFGQITFTGLESNRSYTFELIGSRSTTGAVRRADYTINGLDSDDGNSVGYDAKLDGYDNHEVMTWTAIAPVYNAGSDAWEITLNVQLASGSEFGYLSNGRITVVPEPATLALLGIGGLAMGAGALHRRRRRA